MPAGRALLCAAGFILTYWIGAKIEAHSFQMQLAHRLVGRFEIPRLDVSAMVTEGADDQALGRGIGHVPDTALPGRREN